MALELQDTATFSGSIGDTSTEQLVVDTASAEYIELLIDDTSGGAPASYDVQTEFYSTAVDGYMQADNQTGLTDQNPEIPTDARGQRVRVTVTNSSGSSADYRISLESFKQI